MLADCLRSSVLSTLSLFQPSSLRGVSPDFCFFPVVVNFLTIDTIFPPRFHLLSPVSAWQVPPFRQRALVSRQLNRNSIFPQIPSFAMFTLIERVETNVRGSFIAASKSHCLLCPSLPSYERSRTQRHWHLQQYRENRPSCKMANKKFSWKNDKSLAWINRLGRRAMPNALAVNSVKFTDFFLTVRGRRRFCQNASFDLDGQLQLMLSA